MRSLLKKNQALLRKLFYNFDLNSHVIIIIICEHVCVCVCVSDCVEVVTRVEISRSFLISSWVQVGPGLEFPNIEKTGRGTVRTRLVFLGQKKLIGSLLDSSEEFLVSLKYEKSIRI